MVKNATPVSGSDAVLKAYNIDSDVRIQYMDQPDFERVAAQFGVFEEWKVVTIFVLYFIVNVIQDGSILFFVV